MKRCCCHQWSSLEEHLFTKSLSSQPVTSKALLFTKNGRWQENKELQMTAMAAEAILLMSQHMWEVTQPHIFEFQIGKEQRHKSAVLQFYFEVLDTPHYHRHLIPLSSAWKQVISKIISIDVWFFQKVLNTWQHCSLYNNWHNKI